MRSPVLYNVFRTFEAFFSMMSCLTPQPRLCSAQPSRRDRASTFTRPGYFANCKVKLSECLIQLARLQNRVFQNCRTVVSALRSLASCFPFYTIKLNIRHSNSETVFTFCCGQGPNCRTVVSFGGFILASGPEFLRLSELPWSPDLSLCGNLCGPRAPC